MGYFFLFTLHEDSEKSVKYSLNRYSNAKAPDGLTKCMARYNEISTVLIIMMLIKKAQLSVNVRWQSVFLFGVMVDHYIYMFVLLNNHGTTRLEEQTMTKPRNLT